jgi:hypothetical protein
MKKRPKPERIQEMNRKFWIVTSVGIVILVLLTLLDHYLTIKYIHSR